MFVKIHKIILLHIFILGLINFPDAGWSKKTIGIFDQYFDVKIGDGRNDGVQRVYCCSHKGHVVEWSYNHNLHTWEMVDCGKITSGPGSEMRQLAIGKVREDGLNRLYAVATNGYVYELTYVNSTWQMIALDTLKEPNTGIAIGKARKDNNERIYICSFGNPVRELARGNHNWQFFDLTQEQRYFFALNIANGRNDGSKRIYCTGWIDKHCLLEYNWHETGYEERVIDSLITFENVVIGWGRNDMVNRVYAAGFLGEIYEFTYGSQGWEKQKIYADVDEWSIYGLCLGQTKADRKIRLYSGGQASDICEHTWDGASWSDTVIDAISGATAYLTVGEGRNDDTTRLYVTGEDSQLWEYTHSNPFVSIVSAKFSRPKLKQWSNTIRFTLTQKEYITLVIYNLAGDEVYRLKNTYFPTGTHTIKIPTKNSSGLKLSVGMYIAWLKSGNLNLPFKFMSIH